MVLSMAPTANSKGHDNMGTDELFVKPSGHVQLH